MQLFGSLDTSRDLQVNDSYILIRDIVGSQRSLMPIGQVVLLVGGPLLDIVSSLVVTLYPGRVRSKQLYLDPVRNQNTAQWQTHLAS
jgi:hypothetical protein